MSTYTVELSLAPNGSAPTHSWTVNSGDVPDEADTSQVLDGLSISWSFPESDPWPSQPDPPTARVGLLLDDMSEIADIGLGDVLNVEVTSAGNRLAQMSGRIGQMPARPVRRLVAGVMVRKMLVDILVVDFLVDLADAYKVTGSWPDEDVHVRWGRIVTAVADQGGPVIPQLSPLIDEYVMEAADVSSLPARGLLDDILRQINTNPDSGYLRGVLDVDVADDTGAYEVDLNFIGPASILTPTPPGVLALVGHVLSVTFDGGSPSPKGIEIPSDFVEEDTIQWIALKYDNVRKVTVTGTSGQDSAENLGAFGTELSLSSTFGDLPSDPVAISSPVARQRMAAMYLPRPDRISWSLDTFTWRPTDAALADLDYPLTVSSQKIDADDERIVQAPVVITGLDPVVNPGSDSPFYGGTLSALTLTIAAGNVLVTGKIARRLYTGQDGSTVAATWADLAANFPAVVWTGGADNIDPTLSWFEIALARNM